MKSMAEDDLKKYLQQAQEAEEKSDFLLAAFFYKKVLVIAKKEGNSELITLCKNKLVEANKKSLKDFKSLHVETKVPTEEIERAVNSILGDDIKNVPANISSTLQRIGIHPFLFPNIEKVEEGARKSIPISHQIASLSMVSSEGHLVKGGSDPERSWIMNMYSLEQELINKLYLKRIFEKLSENGLNEKSFVNYLRETKIFPENNLTIIARGLNRYFEKDYISALHILVPQFENLFLLLSEGLGIDVVALNRGKEVSMQLRTLSLHHLDSEPFKEKWTRDFCEQIKFVMFDPLGYKLRHKIAHGEVSASECTSEAVNLIIYFILVLAARIKTA